MWSRNRLTWNVSTIRELNNNGLLVLRPEYQRDLVWKKARKQRLIWCMLADRDIPKFHVNAQSKSRNEPISYDVVDGQQRFDAILSYLNDGFALHINADDIQGIKVAGRKFSQLPEANAQELIY